MDFILKQLGKRLSVSEVSKILGVDPRTVRKYYSVLGGIKLGDRRIIFFEKEFISAIQRQTKQETTLDRSNQKGRKEKTESFPHKEKGSFVGTLNADQRDLNRHGLFN